MNTAHTNPDRPHFPYGQEGAGGPPPSAARAEPSRDPFAADSPANDLLPYGDDEFYPEWVDETLIAKARAISE